MRRRDLLKAAPALMAPAFARAEARPLRYIPNAGLSTIDPIWTTALIAGIHGYMVFDTLYGLDAMGQSRPQMCAGHEVSADGLTWTFTLRDGLTFHDGERVLAKDCAMSVRRWGSRDLFGQPLLAATNDIETIDDRRFRIRLKRPFSQMLYGLRREGMFHDAGADGENAWHRANQGGRRVGTIPLPARRSGSRASARPMRGSTDTCLGRNRRASWRAARRRMSSVSNGSCSRTRRPRRRLCEQARLTGSRCP